MDSPALHSSAFDAAAAAAAAATAAATATAAAAAAATAAATATAAAAALPAAPSDSDDDEFGKFFSGMFDVELDHAMATIKARLGFPLRDAMLYTIQCIIALTSAASKPDIVHACRLRPKPG
jgi:hypothetical protein